MNKITPLKRAIGLILFGVIGMILICAISLLLYGRIYMYDGYEITGILWTICFISLGIGIPLLVAVLCKDKHPKVAKNALKIIVVVLIVVVIMLLLKSCGLLGDLFGSSDGSGGTCGICGGDGFVTFKSLGEGSGVQHGFDTYYRCKGCHGTGKR